MQITLNNSYPDEFTLAVNTLIKLVSDTIPDRVDDLSVRAWMDFYPNSTSLKIVLSLCIHGTTQIGNRVHWEQHITFPCEVDLSTAASENEIHYLRNSVRPILISELLQIVTLSKTGSFVYKNGVVGNELEDLFTTNRGV